MYRLHDLYSLYLMNKIILTRLKLYLTRLYNRLYNLIYLNLFIVHFFSFPCHIRKTKATTLK